MIHTLSPQKPKHGVSVHSLGNLCNYTTFQHLLVGQG